MFSTFRRFLHFWLQLSPLLHQPIITFVTDTCYIHLFFNNPLLPSFELVLRHFTDIAILTDVSRITTSQLTSQQLYTLLRHISHIASSPRHLSHTPDLHFHIYHHSLVCFACLSAKDCRTPWTVTLRSLWSHCSHTHCTAFGFWVLLLLCTALNRRLSAYHQLLGWWLDMQGSVSSTWMRLDIWISSSHLHHSIQHMSIYLQLKILYHQRSAKIQSSGRISKMHLVH